ncbi:PAAR motif-containing protein [Geotalea daltonii FRC-32]|uniref:PAAR motif-containing protein n=1 Tax=Geotalea daltonii (strain DSM 22248 / JCM 15807 / FRC-32) TaxID=316067 RepID=B9M7I1_GEODF|nr:PAAR domain-containing protein [Geotalea daltonii]ACM22087.1 PAAR motif-containing protein [Geotalea daltonii FRC-32]
MPAAARVGDTTTHGGTITGPGSPTVLIGGKPAAVAGDMHSCTIPVSQAHPLAVSTFPFGSTTVLIGNKPALRATDACLCGAKAAVGEPTVQIG